MRTAVLALLLTGLTVSGDEKPTERASPRWDATYLETKFGLNRKSVKYEGEGSVAAIFLFEFTKDSEDVKALRKALGVPEKNGPPEIVLYFFDADNVVIHKMPFKNNTSKAGDPEITGRRGDAFRFRVESISSMILDKSKKVEFRPVEPK